MGYKHEVIEDTYHPSIGCRFKVEAAMLAMIDELKRQGLGIAEIALSLADAAEDYVLRLANCTDDMDDAVDDAVDAKPPGH